MVVVAEPRLVGGHVALDLVNTVAPRSSDDPDPVDYLGGAAELLRWARRVDLITPDEADLVEAAWIATPAAAGEALHAAIDVREATYGILLTALGVSRDSAGGAAAELDRLRLRWSAATTRSALVLAGPSGPAAVLSAGVPGPMLIPDRLAYAAVDLIRTIDLAQLGICPVADGGCGWLFLDRSRNRSRRWCTMEDCGTHAKSRRLTQRRRAHRTA